MPKTLPLDCLMKEEWRADSFGLFLVFELFKVITTFRLAIVYPKKINWKKKRKTESIQNLTKGVFRDRKGFAMRNKTDDDNVLCLF